MDLFVHAFERTFFISGLAGSFFDYGTQSVAHVLSETRYQRQC